MLHGCVGFQHFLVFLLDAGHGLQVVAGGRDGVGELIQGGGILIGAAVWAEGMKIFKGLCEYGHRGAVGGNLLGG